MEPQRSGPFPFTPINRRPRLELPEGAQIAVWVVPNFEVFALNEAMPATSGYIPDVPAWSTRDYGCRVGAFRIMDVLSQRGIRATATVNSEVCDAYPEIIEDAVALEWEFLGHNQSNTRRLIQIPPETEAQVIHDSLARVTEATGRRPTGWLGSGMQQTWNTLDFLVEEGLDYVCDWINDDQPYLMDIGGKQLVSMPYSREINDLPTMFWENRSVDEYENSVRRAFNTLYREGAQSGRVMAIPLHPYVIGMSHRIWALESVLDYIQGHDRVWFATGEQIVNHYLKSGATF
jgi:peptidoglycan/xylan/chitin deacetylase (PgdA/CDA1 family)